MEDRRNGSCHGGGEGSCGIWCPREFLLLRLLIGLAIVGLVFWAGVEVGDFRSEFGHSSRYGRHGMMRSSYDIDRGMMSWGSIGAPIMMQGAVTVPAEQSAAPAKK